jgi:acetolactate synthase-1/2/3 large subunit
MHGLNYELYKDESDSHQILPQAVVQHVYQITNGDAYVTSDVGQHQMFAAQYYHFDKPRRWINSGGLGTMGFGLPSAMGVKLAFPDEEVLCITGEGSIQMCIQELSTCMQYNLPIKIININNEALGMVKQWQDMNYGGRHSESTYKNSLPDFVKLAESYGHVGIKIEKNSELKSGLEKAFAMKDKLVFVDIYVDPSEHVYPMLVANNSLEDMWLSKDKKT